MSLLGKVLAILNVLAALAFLALAAVDWGTRNAWQHAVFRGDLLLRGLPMDKEERDADGNLIHLEINEAMQRDLFQGDRPVVTQADAVQRAKEDVLAKVEQVADGKPRAAKWAAVLGPLARTFVEREQIADAAEAGKVDELRSQFERACTDALETKAPDERRLAVAQLLFGLIESQLEEGEQRLAYAAKLDQAPQSPAYKRFVTVVGLESATRAAEEQAKRLRRLVRDTGPSPAEQPSGVSFAIERERANFVAEYDRLLAHVLGLADTVRHSEATLTERKAQVASQQAVVNEREAEVRRVGEELANEQKTTAEVFKRLKELSSELLAARLRLRDAAAENQNFERRVRELEAK